MCVLFCTRTHSSCKAFDIQRFKSNKNASSVYGELCKATLCVLDAEIWIIRVLHVFLKKETRCELEADFSASYPSLSLALLSSLSLRKGGNSYLFHV